MSAGRFLAPAVLALIAAAGCTTAPAPRTTSTVDGSATSVPRHSPTPMPTPRPTLSAFPELSGESLVPGIYDSSPPFAVEFTFEIPDEGWSSAHIHEEFFDVMRLDGPEPNVPTRWLAWGYPDTIHGPDGERPADGLTPAEAIELMSHVPNVEASAPRAVAFAGLDGVQADLHTDVAMTQIFGGAAGDLALEPSFDVRVGAFQLDTRLLMVMCFGPDGDLQAGCADAQPIIDSVDLVGN